MLLLGLVVTIAVRHVGADLSFLAIGDWGVDLDSQYDTAHGMGLYGLQHNPWFILALGDNFYPRGVLAADDPRFNTTWKNVYNAHEGIRDLTWYISVGNHDHGIDERELFQVQYAETDSQWYFPHLWYDFTKYDADTDTTIHFICVDTQSIIEDKYVPDEQLDWLEQTINASTADWIVMFAHHPPYNAGRRSGEYSVQLYVCPIIDAEVAKGRDNIIFLTGHDHNQQHIVHQEYPNVDYIVSGAGGRGLYAYDEINHDIIELFGMELKDFQFEYGFSSFFFEKSSYKFEFVNQNATVSYTFTRQRANQ